MKFWISALFLCTTLVFTACKSSSKTSSNQENLKETLEDKNRQSISLLNRIRRLPGISISGGIPILVKGNNSIQSNSEPLYVLDSYPVGNSFKSVNGLVENINIKKVEILSSSDASLYGSRAASGVIKITTYN